MAGEDLYELLKPAEAVLRGELLDDKLLELPNLNLFQNMGGLDNLDLDFIKIIYLHFKRVSILPMWLNKV